jgi:tetratricopeptide (TPR) repeat protein
MLAGLLFVTGQYDAALAANERASALARAEGDERTGARAAWARPNLLQMLGRLGEALQASQAALPLAEAVGDLEDRLGAHRDLAYLHAFRGALATGRDYIERALALAEQLGDPLQIADMLRLRGWLAFLWGDWPRARADLDRAVALTQQADQSWYSAYVLHHWALLALAEGDRAAAATAAQEALALVQTTGDLQALRWAASVLAELEVLAGQAEAAVERLVPLLDRPGRQDYDVTALLPVLAWAYLECGQLSQAATVVRQALERARPEEMGLVLVEALRVQALIAARQEQWEEGARSLEEALTLARGMPYPYAEARLLHVYGRLHMQQGEPQAARERLEAARALFQRLGARMDLELTEQALTPLPGTPPGDSSPQPPATPSTGHVVEAAAPAGARLSRTDRHAWALACLRAEGALSPRAYARALGVSVDTALLDLRELVDRGLVRAEGTTRDRRYVLAGDDRRDSDSPKKWRDSPKASCRPPDFGESRIFGASR